MKKFYLLLFVLFLVSAAQGETTQKTGGFNVFSRTGHYEILLDGEKVGTTPVKIENIQAGSHFIQAVSAGVVVSEEMVQVKEGELTTLLVPKEEVSPSTNEVKTTEEIKSDYSEKTYSGFYGALGYLSSSYYSTSWWSDDYVDVSGASIGYGVGYKLGFAPHLDFSLEISRADLSSNDSKWYVMPLSFNAAFSFNTNGKNYKNYVGFGVSQIMTNLTGNGNNLSGAGYNLCYGYEAPAGKDAAFYEVGYNISHANDISTSILYLRLGYRWNSEPAKNEMVANNQ